MVNLWEGLVSFTGVVLTSNRRRKKRPSWSNDVIRISLCWVKQTGPMDGQIIALHDWIGSFASTSSCFKTVIDNFSRVKVNPLWCTSKWLKQAQLVINCPLIVILYLLYQRNNFSRKRVADNRRLPTEKADCRGENSNLRHSRPSTMALSAWSPTVQDSWTS